MPDSIWPIRAPSPCGRARQTAQSGKVLPVALSPASSGNIYTSIDSTALAAATLDPTAIDPATFDPTALDSTARECTQR